jgi:predicted DNA-binding protein
MEGFTETMWIPFWLRLTDDVDNKLLELQQAKNSTKAEIVRVAIIKYHREVFGNEISARKANKDATGPKNHRSGKRNRA